MGVPSLMWMRSTQSRIGASPNWPKVEGTVVSSDVKIDRHRIRGGSHTLYYRSDVHYRYEVKGKSYESSTFMFGTERAFRDSALAAADVEARPVGSKVAVSYDPADPAHAALLPGEAPEGFWVVKAFIVGMILIGFALIASAVVTRRRKSLRSSVPTAY
jgi:hypothetical protein